MTKANEPRHAVYDLLRHDPGVQAAVGTRIYQRQIPPGAKKPLIIVHPLVSRVPEKVLGGTAYRQVRLQITAVADKQPEAEKAISAVIDALDDFTGKMGSLDVIQASIAGERQMDYPDIGEIYHHADVILLY